MMLRTYGRWFVPHILPMLRCTALRPRAAATGNAYTGSGTTVLPA